MCGIERLLYDSNEGGGIHSKVLKRALGKKEQIHKGRKEHFRPGRMKNKGFGIRGTDEHLRRRASTLRPDCPDLHLGRGGWIDLQAALRDLRFGPFFWRTTVRKTLGFLFKACAQRWTEGTHWHYDFHIIFPRELSDCVGRKTSKLSTNVSTCENDVRMRHDIPCSFGCGHAGGRVELLAFGLGNGLVQTKLDVQPRHRYHPGHQSYRRRNSP